MGKKNIKIGIATSSFNACGFEPLELLKNQGFIITKNNIGKKMDTQSLLHFAGGLDGILAGTESYSKDVIKQLSELKVISRLGVGVDNIDLNAAIKQNIRVYKTTTTPAPSVSELVLGLMIDVYRNITNSSQLLKIGTWEKQMGSLLQGKRLGIIGLGTIGKELVRLASGFRFKVLAYDKQEDELFAKENDVTYCSLETLLIESDIVSIHLNLTDQTKHLIDKEKFKLMKPDAILINSSRGEIIDETALYEALKTKQLIGAGLDVFEKEPYTGPLTSLGNVVLTPHIGAYAKEIRIKMEMEAAENLIRGLNEI